MNWSRLSTALLLTLAIGPAAGAALPFPADLLPQPNSVASYDKVIAEDELRGLEPTARLTTAVSGWTPFDFGDVSGDATIEFILEGDPSLGTGSAYLAVGSNSLSNLRYEQWNNTGRLGFTQLQVADYLFTGWNPSPTTPTHVTFVWDAAALTMHLYVDGRETGTSSGVSPAFAMPTGPGWLAGRDTGAELMDGTIHRVTVYNYQVAPDVIQRHANAYYGLGERLGLGGSSVAIDGDLAATGSFQGTDIFELENGSWQRRGSLDARGSSLAFQGGTLVVGDGSASGGSGRAYVYARGTEPGLNAWALRDVDTGGPSANYIVDVPADLDAAARTNGWRYRLVSRFVDDFGSDVCMAFYYGDGAQRYLVYFDLEASGDLAVELFGATPQRHVLTSGGSGATAYHTHELIFNPTNQMVTYLFDDAPIHTWAGQNGANDGIFWGSGSTGGKGAMNVHQARFEVLSTGAVLASYDAGTGGNPAVAPDPLAEGWSLSSTNRPFYSTTFPLSPDFETVWQRQAVLRASDGASNDRFGNTVDISGETIVVGAPYDDVGGTDTGSAYVFVHDGTNWTQQKKLAPSVRSVNDSFGQSVAIDGDSILVGAPNRWFGTQSNPGRAFVFTRSGGDWIQQAQLLAQDGGPRETFGYAVDLEGDRAVVSAASDGHSGRTFAGSVYVFERNGSSWTQRSKMIADPVTSGLFGTDVALRGDAIVVGAHDAGHHYLFTRSGSGIWVQRQIRIYGDSRVVDVGFDGTRFIVGVGPIEDQGENAAYIYSPDYSNSSALKDFAGQLLYYPEAAASGFADPNQAAFRYKHLLYGQSNGFVRARSEMMSGFFGPAERSLAASVEAEVMKGLSLSPSNAALGELLLDLCYDRTVAETILAKDIQAMAERARFGPPISSNAPSGFIIDNEIALYRQASVTNRNVMQCYFDLLKRELDIQQVTPASTRWASSVLGFSSENSSTFRSAVQVLGEPDTYPRYGDFDTAWTGRTPDDQREFLELGYANPAPIHSVSVYQTLNPGAVDKVSVRNLNTGEWLEVWAGKAAPTEPGPRIFTATFPATTFAVDAVRVDFDSPAVPGQSQIDAVSISGPSLLMTTTDPTFGHRLFQTHVPNRGLMPATYTNASGVSMMVTTNSAALTNGMLFTGYKDLVLLFDLLRDYGRNTATFARLLASRHNAGDVAEAQAIVSDAQRFLFLQGSLLKNMFASLPPSGDPSGLAQAIDGWGQTLYSLAELQQTLAIDANPLGFAPDFLMLAENFFGVENHFDSFDSFAERLSLGSANSILLRARASLQNARDTYADYRGYEDQLNTEFEGSTGSYEFRLFEIVGAFPGETGYGDNPTAHPGSELDQQYRSIELARLRILKNQTDISNLRKEVQIERQRAAAVSEIVVRYGNQQANLTQEIGEIEAAQAAANQLTEYFNPENLLSGASIAIALNAGVQTIAELEKAKLEATKERLAGLEQAEIVGAESAARVKTLLLRMNTLVLDSQEAALLLNQEVARFAALYREKGELEKRLDEAQSAVASRYFADPIHRLSSQSAMVDANLSFDEARKWLFFMNRALEYKVNTPFTNNFLGRTWDSRSVVKARNAAELVDIYDAMIDYSDQASRTRQPETSWFSIREDHLGYRDGVDSQGQPLRYFDPATGELVPAIEAFRRHLRANIRELAGNSAEIVLEFSTARDLFATASENFFRGPSFDLNGNPVDGGAYLDKIDGLHLRLPGTHTISGASVPGRLTYGGTSFIRNPRVGTFDPARPDRLRNELTAYSTRYWFRDSVDLVWRFAEAFSSQVTLTKSPGPRMETTAEQIIVFKERSVAATGWVLSLRIRSGGQQLLNIDEMTDVEILFRHSSIGRQ